MSNGMWRITHAIQTSEAWKDWRTCAAQVSAAGRDDLVKKYAPKEGAGWRMVDRKMLAMLAEMGWKWNHVTRRAEVNDEQHPK